MIKYPQSIKFHKKIAQLQVDLKRPEEVEGDQGRLKIKDGCIFLTAAKQLNPDSDRMDWENKLLMKLGAVDIVNFLAGINRNTFPIKLFHKVQGTDKSSTLNVEAGDRPGTFKWSIGNSNGTDKRYVNIYLDGKDMLYLKIMFEAALPVISGWVS